MFVGWWFFLVTFLLGRGGGGGGGGYVFIYWQKQLYSFLKSLHAKAHAQSLFNLKIEN